MTRPAPLMRLVRKARSSKDRLLRFAVDEAPAYLWNSRAPVRPGCVIFAQGRTGTWLLHSLLNQHPELHFGKEILQQPVLWPSRYVLSKARAAQPAFYGCHIQVNQLLNTQRIDAKGFIKGLSDQGWHILHLRRENIIRQSISAILAVQRGQWVAHKAISAPQPMVEIDIDQVIERIRRRQHHAACEAEVLADVPHLSLIYEEDLEQETSHQPTADRIFRYLNVDLAEVSAKTHRTTPQRVQDVLTNYDQLMDKIALTFPELM